MKSKSFYTAMTKAVDDYNNRHNLNRGYFADVLGYKGDNASRQLSAALNPHSDDKTLNDERKEALIEEMDIDARMVFFTAYMKQWGLKPEMIDVPAVSIEDINIHIALDNALIESDDAFKTGKFALRDKTLDEAELRAIIKESEEAARKHDETAMLAKARLKTLRSE